MALVNSKTIRRQDYSPSVSDKSASIASSGYVSLPISDGESSEGIYVNSEVDQTEGISNDNCNSISSVSSDHQDIRASNNNFNRISQITEEDNTINSKHDDIVEQNLEDENTTEYINCESEEDDIDIPTEEHYLRSSTSVSGDDDGGTECSSSMTRPRSVHFEDEYWEDGRYVTKGLSKSDGTLYVNSSSSRSQDEEMMDYNNSRAHIMYSMRLKPSNVKSARRESVRDMLRKRREGMEEFLEQDGRRRVKPIDVDESFLRPSRSSFKNLRGRGGKKSTKNALDTSSSTILKKSQSLYDVNNYSRTAKKQNLPHRERPVNRSRPNSKPRIIQAEDAAYITTRDFALLQSLVGGTNSNSSSSSSNRSVQRENQKRYFVKSRKSQYYDQNSR